MSNFTTKELDAAIDAVRNWKDEWSYEVIGGQKAECVFVEVAKRHG